MSNSDDQLKKNQMQPEAEERPIIDDLRCVGVDVNSIWFFGKKHADKFHDVVPILIKHLKINYSDRIREGIARALGKARARKESWEVILDMYLKEPNREDTWFKDGLADALAEMARQSDLPTLIQLMDDQKNGRTRVFFYPKSVSL